MPQRAAQSWALAYAGLRRIRAQRLREAPAPRHRPVQYMAFERAMAPHQKKRSTQAKWSSWIRSITLRTLAEPHLTREAPSAADGNGEV
ncbi:hypothetical protein ADENT20671_0891 [Actinomyces denticolens]|nr:hypothetical protein ADENT20671_0891 [Actinomyces denticolens]